MKNLISLSLMFIAGLTVQLSAAHHENASVYVIHGIPGQDLGLDPALPVDISVNETCTLTALKFGQAVGPLMLAPGTYNLKIGIADPLNPCSNPPVIDVNVPFTPGEVAVVVAHLKEDGLPKASKFNLDYSPAPESQSRITIQHTANAPEVDVYFRSFPRLTHGQIKFSSVVNGDQANLIAPAQNWYFSLNQPSYTESLIGPLEFPVGLSKAYHGFVVGSANHSSLNLLVFQSPLTPGAKLKPVSAQLVVIHGIPGEDLGLPEDLPVDISLNGNPALTNFRFGEVTPPIALPAGSYHIDISPANQENPGSEPPLIQSDVTLHSGDLISVVAHLTANKAPTAGVFTNLNTSYHLDTDPILFHHLAAAPAVDIQATYQLVNGYRTSYPLLDVINGQQGVIDAEPGNWWVELYPAANNQSYLAGTKLAVDAISVPSLFAVGSLDNQSLSLIETRRPRFQTLETLALHLNESGAYEGLLDSLLTAVLTSDPTLLQALAGNDKLTVFAPTDQAFAELGLTPETIPEQDPSFLTQVLLTHVVPDTLPAETVLNKDTLITQQGSVLLQNGGVLTDPQGRQAAILVTDLFAGNGVVHVIDSVLLPAEPQPSLLDLALELNEQGIYAGQFDTLVAAVQSADPSIAAALTGEAALTVFAPTDEAFESLDLRPENIDSLGQTHLTDILLYHVTAGKQLAADVLGQTTLSMLKGGNLLQNAGVLTDNLGRTSRIVFTDVEASNGVIHVIDSVVLPAAP